MRVLLVICSDGPVRPPCWHARLKGNNICIDCRKYVIMPCPQPGDSFWALELLIRIARVAVTMSVLGPMLRSQS